MGKHQERDLSTGTNGEIARVIVGEKAILGMTNKEFEEKSGLSWRTMHRKLESYQRDLTIREVEAAGRAVGLDLPTILKRAADRLKE